MVPEKALSVRQRQFIKEIADNPRISKSEAAKRAGYSIGQIPGRTAKVQGSRMAKHPTIARAIERIYAKAGITDTLLATRVKEGLDAMQESRHENVMREDPKTRLGYIRLVHELKGDLQETPSGTTPIVLNIGFAHSWGAEAPAPITVSHDSPEPTP